MPSNEEHPSWVGKFYCSHCGNVFQKSLIKGVGLKQVDNGYQKKVIVSLKGSNLGPLRCLTCDSPNDLTQLIEKPGDKDAQIVLLEMKILELQAELFNMKKE